jgi:hypothetical protein
MTFHLLGLMYLSVVPISFLFRGNIEKKKLVSTASTRNRSRRRTKQEGESLITAANDGDNADANRVPSQID